MMGEYSKNYWKRMYFKEKEEKEKYKSEWKWLWSEFTRRLRGVKIL